MERDQADQLAEWHRRAADLAERLAEQHERLAETYANPDGLGDSIPPPPPPADWDAFDRMAGAARESREIAEGAAKEAAKNWATNKRSGGGSSDRSALIATGAVGLAAVAAAAAVGGIVETRNAARDAAAAHDAADAAHSASAQAHDAAAAEHDAANASHDLTAAEHDAAERRAATSADEAAGAVAELADETTAALDDLQAWQDTITGRLDVLDKMLAALAEHDATSGWFGERIDEVARGVAEVADGIARLEANLPVTSSSSVVASQPGATTSTAPAPGTTTPPPTTAPPTTAPPPVPVIVDLGAIYPAGARGPQPAVTIAPGVTLTITPAGPLITHQGDTGWDIRPRVTFTVAGDSITAIRAVLWDLDDGESVDITPAPDRVTEGGTLTGQVVQGAGNEARTVIEWDTPAATIEITRIDPGGPALLAEIGFTVSAP